MKTRSLMRLNSLADVRWIDRDLASARSPGRWAGAAWKAVARNVASAPRCGQGRMAPLGHRHALTQRFHELEGQRLRDQQHDPAHLAGFGFDVRTIVPVAGEDLSGLLHPPAQRAPGYLAFRERHDGVGDLVLCKRAGRGEQRPAVAFLADGLGRIQADEQDARGGDAGDPVDQQRRSRRPARACPLRKSSERSPSDSSSIRRADPVRGAPTPMTRNSVLSLAASPTAGVISMEFLRE